MIVPTGYRVLVEDIIENEQMEGSIYLPDSAKTLDGYAKVVKLGRGLINKEGQQMKDYPVKEGDTVIIPLNRECGTVVHHDDKRYKIFDVEDLLGIVK
jgi:co-chaperonin GroES (HSP10)